MQFIASQTVGAGGVSSVTFSNIPATFTHLQLRCFAQAVRATYGIGELALRFNSDTGNNYSWHGLYGDGASAISEAGINATDLRANGMLGTTTGGTYGAFIIDILDYANTSKNKVVKDLCGNDINGSIAGYGGRAGEWSGAWFNTNAINSINVFSPNGNLTQYSRFDLYGITTSELTGA